MLGNSSKYIGVSWSEERKKWCAGIAVNKKRISLGRYATELEAAQARDTYIIGNKLQDFVLNFK